MNMTKHVYHENYHDCFEYHGNTTIAFIRKHFGQTVKQDWILFDSIEEATDYFDCEDFSELPEYPL
jgi:hypothetical protein